MNCFPFIYICIYIFFFFFTRILLEQNMHLILYLRSTEWHQIPNIARHCANHWKDTGQDHVLHSQILSWCKSYSNHLCWEKKKGYSSRGNWGDKQSPEKRNAQVLGSQKAKSPLYQYDFTSLEFYLKCLKGKLLHFIRLILLLIFFMFIPLKLSSKL